MKKVLFLTSLPNKLEIIGILVNVVTVILIATTIFGIKVPVFINGKLGNAKKEDSGFSVQFYSSDGIKDFDRNNDVILCGTYGEDPKMKARIITSSLENDTLTLELFMGNSETLLKSLSAQQKKQARLMIQKNHSCLHCFI